MAPDVGRYVLLGLFGLVCLGISALMTTLHEALARSKQLTEEVRRNSERNAATDNRLRMLAQAAPVALFLADRVHSCTYCNQAWLAIRGQRRSRRSSATAGGRVCIPRTSCAAETLCSRR